VPWLLGWSYPALDPGVRKAFEVALHAGAAIGLAITLRRDLADALRDRRQLVVIMLGSVPAGLAGLSLESRIETRLGTPGTIAAGLASGAALLALADRSPQTRRLGSADPAEGVWLGLAQAAALVPGVSRNGAALAAARLLGFQRPDAWALSRRLGFPVIAAATLLKTWRLAARAPAPADLTMAAGAGASLASTLVAASRLARRVEGPLLPYAIYRVGLALALLIRLRRGSTGDPPPPARP
jgi:undecaprenyl-diphosphatase